jgi:pimeloyl-ACP methyl ester carboxylesterase
VNRFLRHLQTIVLRTRDSISDKFLGWRVSKPDPAEALATEWHFAKTGERGRRLFVFLPGRRDRGSDFFRRGLIALAQERVPGLDCVAVDATIGYYLDGSIADRLHCEIVGPARTLGYGEIWLVGVSMGGLGAFFHERAYPAQVTGLILLAPFLGDDWKLLAAIDAAGGAVAWASSQLVDAAKPNRTEFQKELWRFLGRLKSDQALQVWMAYGEGDRLLPGIERLRPLIPGERVVRLPGGHTWEVWILGFTEILSKIAWDRTLPADGQNNRAE